MPQADREALLQRLIELERQSERFQHELQQIRQELLGRAAPTATLGPAHTPARAATPAPAVPCQGIRVAPGVQSV